MEFGIHSLQTSDRCLALTLEAKHKNDKQQRGPIPYQDNSIIKNLLKNGRKMCLSLVSWNENGSKVNKKRLPRLFKSCFEIKHLGNAIFSNTSIPYLSETTSSQFLAIVLKTLFKIAKTKSRNNSSIQMMVNANPGLFFVYFGLFKQTLQFFTANMCEKSPSKIQCRDSNPRPSECDSPPITTRPGLPPRHCIQCY